MGPNSWPPTVCTRGQGENDGTAQSETAGDGKTTWELSIGRVLDPELDIPAYEDLGDTGPDLGTFGILLETSPRLLLLLEAECLMGVSSEKAGD